MLKLLLIKLFIIKKKSFPILFFLFIALLNVNAQSLSDSIVIKKVFGGYQFLHNEKILKMPQLVQLMENNELAYKEIKEAQSTYSIATVLGTACGALIGWPIGTAIGGGEPVWALAGIGAGLMVISIPLSKKFNKQALKAVNTYNSEFRDQSFNNLQPVLNIGLTSNGIGLHIDF